MSTSARRARRPSVVSSEPISTRSGASRSLTALPSARNSGLERTWKRSPREFELRIRAIASAVRTGSVDFSTTILPWSDSSRICRAVFSQVLQVGGAAGALPEDLGRRVDRHEDDVRGANAAGDVGREEQIPAARPSHHLVQPRLEDRQPVAVPGGDAFGVDVGHGDANVGAAIGDDRHGRAADVAGADAENVCRCAHSFFSPTLRFSRAGSAGPAVAPRRLSAPGHPALRRSSAPRRSSAASRWPR